MLKYAEHVNILTACTSSFASVTSPSQIYFLIQVHTQNVCIDNITLLH